MNIFINKFGFYLKNPKKPDEVRCRCVLQEVVWGDQFIGDQFIEGVFMFLRLSRTVWNKPKSVPKSDKTVHRRVRREESTKTDWKVYILCTIYIYNITQQQGT